MSLIVHKYGGTSMGSVERIRQVARRVAAAKDQGHDLVVVVSAMAGETDRLTDLAYEICADPPAREVDMLISTGEQVSASLLAMALCDIGHPAISFTGSQIGMLTVGHHRKARIQEVHAERVIEKLRQGLIVIITGFQGLDVEGNITTLGRGGSDTSAVAVAAVLKADLCEIYTDVDGVYTADPRLVPNARKLKHVSHDTMLEMATLGAKVLQSRSVEFAKKYHVPLAVRSTFSDDPGTLIVEEISEMESTVLTGVTLLRDQARINVLDLPNVPGIAAKIFKAVAEEGVNVDMIVLTENNYGGTDISFTLGIGDIKIAHATAERICNDVSAKGVTVEKDVAKVSVVGIGMQSQPGVAADLFDALGSNGINIEMISTSEIKISCLIKSKDVDLAMRVIHERFKLGEDAVIADKETQA
ncbi:MAG: aspartate kinase [Verrucomicrobia bacterium]|nr:aspartate kinase [Verrucomicrobiota bacterium]